MRPSLTALVLIAAFALPTSDLGAQGSFGIQRQKPKSPMTARIIGILPGAGHIYAGETNRGLAFFAGTLGVLAVGGAISDAQCKEDEYSTDYCSSPVLDVLALVAGAGVWAWSIVDAGRAARRTNARHGLSAVIFEPVRLPDARHHDRPALRIGLSL